MALPRQAVAMVMLVLFVVKVVVVVKGRLICACVVCGNCSGCGEGEVYLRCCCLW